MPVIDEPSTLTLWSSMDLSGWGDTSNSDSTDLKGKAPSRPSPCPAFYLDSKALSHSIKSSLKILDQELQMIELGVGEISKNSSNVEKLLEKKKTRRKRLEHILNDSKDLFLRVLNNDEISIKALVNLETKPPTLFESFTVLHLKPDFKDGGVDAIKEESRDGNGNGNGKVLMGLTSLDLIPLLPNPVGKHSSILQPNAILSGISTSQIGPNWTGRTSSVKVEIEMGGLFDGDAGGWNVKSNKPSSGSSKADRHEHSKPIDRIIADSEGRRVLTLGQESKNHNESLVRELVSWEMVGVREELSRGLSLLKSRSLGALSSELLTLLPNGLGIALINNSKQIELVTGLGSQVVPSSSSGSPDDQTSFITSFPSSPGKDQLHSCLLLTFTASGRVSLWELKQSSFSEPLEIKVITENNLPRAQERNSDCKYFALDHVSLPSFGSISSTGTIELYKLNSSNQWICSSKIETGRSNQIAVKANCSGQVALVSSTENSDQELSIWNLKESEFSSGLEHSEGLDGQVQALEWSAHGSEPGRRLLVLAFKSQVKVLCPSRLSHDRKLQSKSAVGWQVVAGIDISNVTSNPISSLSLLSNCQLLIATSNQLLSYGPYVNLGSNSTKKHLIDSIEERNGALRQFHPVMMRECLKWGKIDVAKKIVVNLARGLRNVRLQDRSKEIGDAEMEVDEIEVIEVEELGAEEFLNDENESGLQSGNVFEQQNDAE